MSEEVNPPIETTDAEGWTVHTYSDGTRTRQKRVGDGLLSEFPAEWHLHGVPEIVQQQDLAAMREAGRRWAMEREKVFLDALLGPGWEQKAGAVQ
jgi:hypothetical protein